MSAPEALAFVLVFAAGACLGVCLATLAGLVGDVGWRGRSPHRKWAKRADSLTEKL